MLWATLEMALSSPSVELVYTSRERILDSKGQGRHQKVQGVLSLPGERDVFESIRVEEGGLDLRNIPWICACSLTALFCFLLFCLLPTSLGCSFHQFLHPFANKNTFCITVKSITYIRNQESCKKFCYSGYCATFEELGYRANAFSCLEKNACTHIVNIHVCGISSAEFPEVF